MNIFGKKDGKMKASAEDADVLVDLAGEENAAGADDGLSAPLRPAPLSAVKERGGKKGTLLALLLLVAGGFGGGYYYLNMMGGEDIAPPLPVAANQAPATVPKPQDAVDSILSGENEGDFAIAASQQLKTGAPPQPEPVMNAGIPDVAGNIAAAIPDTVPAVPAADTALTAAPLSGVSALEEDMVDDIGEPPADDALPIVPSGMVAPAGEEGVPPLPPAAEKVAAVAAIPDSQMQTPQGEIIPDMGEIPADLKAAPEVPQVPEMEMPEIAADAPSAAELALAQNAPLLAEGGEGGASSPDALAAISKLVEQPAIVRELPKSYLVVHKDRDADDVDSRLTAARLALSQGRNQAALQFFDELYQQSPRDKRVMMGRAVALQKLGQAEDALTAYEDVLADDPKNLEALTNMLGLIKTQDPGLALEKLKELRDIYPYNADITAQLGVAQAERGNYKEAMKYMNMADALKPGSAYVLYNKAVLYDKMGASAQAADIYRQIVRMSMDGNLDAPLPIDQIKNRLATMR